MESNLASPGKRAHRSSALTSEEGVDARKDAARIELEYFALVCIGDCERIDVALGVVEVIAGLWIDAAHCAHHFRAEQDVVDVDDFEQQVDAWLVINAGVKEHVR